MHVGFILIGLLLLSNLHDACAFVRIEFKHSEIALERETTRLNEGTHSVRVHFLVRMLLRTHLRTLFKRLACGRWANLFNWIFTVVVHLMIIQIDAIIVIF